MADSRRGLKRMMDEGTWRKLRQKAALQKEHNCTRCGSTEIVTTEDHNDSEWVRKYWTHYCFSCGIYFNLKD